MSDYTDLCARLRHNCECDSETMYQCDSCTASYTIESQAREIAELRALVMAWNEVWDNVRIDVQNLREDNKPLAVAATYELLRQDRDALRQRAEAAERDAAELRRVARYVEIPVRNAMRGVNVIRLAGEPCQNIEVSWHTAYESAQEFLAAIAAGGK